MLVDFAQMKKRYVPMDTDGQVATSRYGDHLSVFVRSRGFHMHVIMTGGSSRNIAISKRKIDARTRHEMRLACERLSGEHHLSLSIHVDIHVFETGGEHHGLGLIYIFQHAVTNIWDEHRDFFARFNRKWLDIFLPKRTMICADIWPQIEDTSSRHCLNFVPRRHDTKSLAKLSGREIAAYVMKYRRRPVCRDELQSLITDITEFKDDIKH